MRILFKSFTELTARELYDALHLRQSVFIIEQDCIYPDIDGKDTIALHLLIYEGDELAAYLRFFPPGTKIKESSMGRIVVRPSYRGTGMGKQLIEQGIQICFEKYPDSPIRIEAQAALRDYYGKYGFIAEGEVYVWDGIDHIQMVLQKN